MRIIIQNSETRLYVKAPGIWVKDPADALNFASGADAVLYCVTQRLPHVQIVMKFGADYLDIRLPLKSPSAKEGFGPQASR